jgi:voltage-gated potassium channel
MSFWRNFRKKRAPRMRDSSLIDALLLAVIMIVIGTVGYALIEGWSLVEALYATIITITTVGYGDMVPTTAGGRLFAIIFTLIAIGAVGYSLSGLAAGIIERSQGRRAEAIRKRQMKRITDLDNHIIICGGGYVGKRIAHELVSAGESFIVIEPDEALMRWTLLYLDEEYRRSRYRETFDLTFQMEDTGHEEMEIASLAETLDIPYIMDSPTSNAVLVRAGIERARGLFAVMSDDRDNLLVVLSARGLARELDNENLRIIARTVEEENFPKLKMAGSSRVFSANLVEAVQLTAHMLHPHTGAFWRMTMDETVPLRYTEVIVDDHPHLAGKTCAEIKINDHYLVMSIFRKGQYINLPDPDDICQPGDVLIVVTEEP